MNRNAIGFATVCSLLSIALSHSVDARSIRADTGQNGWNSSSTSFTDSSYLLNPGVTTGFAATYANVAAVNDDIGLQATSGIEYNWYSSATSNIQAAEDQIVVYTLDNNSADAAGGTTPAISSGDIEVEFNYDYLNEASLFANNTSTASFSIGNYTYSGVVDQIYTSPNDFLFSASGALLGAFDASGDLVSGLGGWTRSPSGGSVSAPEVDPSSAVSALTLLVGVLAILQNRRKPGMAVVGA
jgi:hypothetical protein